MQRTFPPFVGYTPRWEREKSRRGGEDRLLTEQGVRASTLVDRNANVKRAIELMRVDLDMPLSHSQLARAARMSEFHFSRVFHDATGLPPLRFQSALRLARARDLVVSTDDAVIEICLRIGYNSIGSFTRRFTELVGISPMRLRQRISERKLPEEAATNGGVRVRLTAEGGELVGPRLVAAFESPLPFGKPLGSALSYSDSVLSLGGLGAKPFYLVAFGSNGKASLRSSPLLVTHEALAASSTLDLVARRIESTDPPILSFVPFMVHWHHEQSATEKP